MKAIDFTSVFTAANTEAEVNNAMTALVESVLKAGHARIAELTTTKGKGKDKKTTKPAETPKAKAETTPKTEAKESAKTGRKTAEECMAERLELIKSAKPGTVVVVDKFDFRTKKNVKLNVTIPTKKEIKALKFKLVDYSENSYAVIGDTKQIKDYLLNILGATFQRNLSCGPGYVFAKNEQGEAIKKALALAM